MFLSNSLIFS